MRPDAVLVSPYPAPGRTHGGSSGVASYTANLARAMAAQGASIVVVAPDEPTTQRAHADGEVSVVRSGPRGPFALTRAIQMAVDLRPGVIHLQHEMLLFGGLSSMATLPMAVSSMRNYERVPITTVHQVVDPEDMSPRFLRMHGVRGPVRVARAAINVYQTMLASAGVTIVHEPGFANHIPNAVVIPHGVEQRTSLHRAPARNRLGIAGEQRLVVLCFGFVAPYKGLAAALSAAADVPEVLLVVAGGDHPRHGVRYTEALKRRWRDVAHFTGWVPEEDIAAWHAAADLALFCYPAPHSSSGSVALALAHKTPLLVSDPLARCMGLPAESAVSLDGGALAERLRGLAANRDSLAILGMSTREVVAGRLWPEVARRHLRLYNKVGSNRSGKPAVGRAPADGQLEVA